MRSVKISRSGMAALMSSPEVKGSVLPFADSVLETAILTAPVDTGRYRDSLHITETDRGYAVVAETDYAMYVEADQGTLARAMNTAKRGA